MKKVIFIFSAILIFFSGCKSKYEKHVDMVEDMIEEYIECLKKAETKEELSGLKKELRRKKKSMDKAFEEFHESKDFDIRHAQDVMHKQKEKIKKLREQMIEAEKDADNRCK